MTTIIELEKEYMEIVAELKVEIKQLKAQIVHLTKTNLSQHQRHEKSYASSARTITCLEQEIVKLTDQVFDQDRELRFERRRYWTLRREIQEDIVKKVIDKAWDLNNLTSVIEEEMENF